MLNLIRTLRLDFSNTPNILGRFVLIVYRIGNYAYFQLKSPILRAPLIVAYKFADIICLRAMMGVHIPAATQIGPGLRIMHGANGIVINANSKIGNNVTLYHQVTLGVRDAGDGDDSCPIIQDDVMIGAGAKVLGAVVVGVGSRIGANAVVVDNIPPHSVAIGSPAKARTK